MFAAIFRFELGYRLRQPMVYVFAALFFFMAFMAIATDSVMIGGAIGNVARNAPYVIIQMLTFLSGMGLVIVAILVASAVNRDRELGTYELFFATPLDKTPYLAGRFAASVMLAFATMFAAAAGILVSSLMPWQDPEHLVAFRWIPYVYALGVFVLPNLLIAGSIFFAVATLTRRAFFAYVAMIGFLCLWGVGQALTRDLDNQLIAALLDPLGLGSFQLTTRYWTVVERNTMLLPLSGHLLANRVIWIGLAMGVLLLTRHRFKMEVGERMASRRTRLLTAVEPITTAAATMTSPIPAVRTTFTRRTRFAQWRCQMLGEIGGVLHSVPFIVIMIFGLFNLMISLIARFEGTISYPVTTLMLRSIDGAFDQFLLIVIVIYAGEMVWRERQTRMHELIDALPVPDWIPLTAKLTALAVICVMALTAAMLTTIGFQLAGGYQHVELPLYLKGLFVVSLCGWLQLCVLALFVQVLANQKYVGYLLMVLYFAAMEALPVMGFEHHLYVFGTTPKAPYSDMNGYGHFVAPLFWFNLYWSLFATGLMLLANLLFVRGTESRVRSRLRQAIERLARRNANALTAVSIGLVLVGAWIFYNTNVLNEYRTSGDENRVLALYERRYKQYEGLPQPRVTGVQLAVDIHPDSRRADIHGDLHLVNKTSAPIDALHLLVSRDLTVNTIDLPAATTEVADREVGYHIYRLAVPLTPGAAMDVSFDVSLITRGFVNDGSNLRIVENGTFFSNSEYVPRIGYAREDELADPGDRKDEGLPPRARMAAVDDPQALRAVPLSHDADRLDFEATVSTSLDQIAIAPGYLQREWTEGDRRFFHYRMDAPIFSLYGFLSGRYEVRRDKWNDVDIAVYHHPTHTYNVDRMIDSVKKSLAYFTANFGPYQHRQVRIIEFPRYHKFAQSLPNTIPFSESAHFIDDVRDEDNIDMVFYITAHEVAHQWWGHQVCGGAVQGWSMIIESMAQYSALMVMEKEFGRDRMKRFLAYELDRYLSGRAKERFDEMPIMLVENQPYIHYNKGSLVMYALRDYIGEETFNAALRRFVSAEAYQGPPYTNTVAFLDYVRQVVPEEMQYLIEDMFETITLYDNRTEDASFTRTEDGRYKVRLVCQSHKMRSDGRGVETAIEHRDWIEVGVFGENSAAGRSEETTLYLEKRHLPAGESEIEIVVDDKPVRAGIDPRNLLIDRVPDDNVRRVSG